MYVHMWNDAKVLALSRPQPNGLSLWVECLAGEQTDAIPGVFKIGEAAFAEQLRWPLKGFRKAFAEVSRQGMVKASWKDRLVWVPNALRYNVPESPNVIRHWEEPWRHLPECDLKTEIHKHFAAFFEALGEGFAKAFREALPESVSSDQLAVISDKAPGPTSGVTPNPTDVGNIGPVKKKTGSKRGSGLNPRAQGTNPRALAEAERRAARAAKEAEHERAKAASVAAAEKGLS